MFHTTNNKVHFSATRGSNGAIVKNINYKGVAAHAGGSPHRVLMPCMQQTGMQAINSPRNLQDLDALGCIQS